MQSFKRQIQPGAVFFRIKVDGTNVNHQNSDYNQLYSFGNKGFVRKAIVTRVQSPVSSERFIDKEFNLVPPPNYKMIRLFDLYKGETNLFPIEEHESSYFQYADRYNSFMAESGVINFKYLKTLFLTQTVNPRGYYQYFVKRNGEYYLEQCDDFIPVHRLTLKPIYGLELQHPYQIILFKAWAKEVNGLQNMDRAEPFTFLQAFGLPEYQVFNFRKEKKFILNEAVHQQYKNKNIKNFALNRNQFLFIARTVNSEAVRKIGLVPNTAAYKINRLKISDKNGQNLYHVYSSLPCSWVGKYSPVYNSSINNFPIQQTVVDLQRNFIITETQLLTYFNKFFVVPLLMDNPASLRVQDCYNFIVDGRPVWLRVNVPQGGTLGLSIQMPKKRGGPKNSYPQFRYFFSRRLDQKQMSRSHFRQDIAGSRMEENMYITSNCDKWEYYLLDYVQGYQNHSSKFAIVSAGEYVLFIHPQLAGTIRVRFDSHCQIQEPAQFQPTPQEAKQIFDSTFFSISKDTTVQATFNHRTYDESITLNNSFEQLGYGSICIKTLINAPHKVAMRVFPDRLRAAGLKLPDHYSSLSMNTDNQSNTSNKQKNFVLASSKGRPQIIVLQRASELSKSQIGQVFPPVGTVEFFKVKPNRMISNIPITGIANNNMLQSNIGALTTSTYVPNQNVVSPNNFAPNTIAPTNFVPNNYALNSFGPTNYNPNINVNTSQMRVQQVSPNVTVSQGPGGPGLRSSNITDSILGGPGV